MMMMMMMGLIHLNPLTVIINDEVVIGRIDIFL
jgi:hypothetical protein